MNIALAFLKKSFLIEKSYRFAFLLRLGAIFIHVLTFYFISRLFDDRALEYLSDYNTTYFPFVLIGLALSNYLYAGLQSYSRNLRSEQMMGTLEYLFMAPLKSSTIILALALWDFIYASINVFVYLFCGIVFLGVAFPDANIISVIIIFALTIICFSGIGLVSASFIMIFKKGDPVTWIISNISILLGGVYFPLSILPDFLKKISALIPLTYSLRALRYAVIQGYSISRIFTDIMILAVFSAILFPVGIIFFNYAIKQAKRQGTLSHY
ncbi:ABC transporter permease [Elusimicrobiota bacterium]